MRILLKTVVHRPINNVSANFDKELFKFLLPPGAKLIHYGGSETDDKVHLKLPLVGTWKSIITDHGKSEDSFYFVDEGEKVPFPLKIWKHKHILHKKGDQTIIEDNIQFSTGFILLDIIVYPFLFFSFLGFCTSYKTVQEVF